jgi:Flp pilus assembly secretin CpaC
MFVLAAASYAQIGTPEFDPLGEHDDLPKQIRVQVEYIDVSQEQLTELLNGEKPAANDVELRKQVGQLVDSGKATIMETMLCIARSGQRAKTESIEEVIYPTEYEPAQLPNTNASDEKDDAVETQQARSDSAIGPTPTSFETRNVGSYIEIEPTLSPEKKSINLTLTPEIVYHVGNKVWAEWKGEHGNSPIQMPTFYVLRINTSVTLADGKPLLLGALTPKTQDGKADFTRKIMVFVKADVITVGR